MTHWSRGESTVLEEARDGLPTSEAPVTPPDGPTETPPDAPIREHEPTYQSDLRGLVALARQRETMTPPPEPMSLDAPPSVREAIRAAGALLPTRAPLDHPLRRVAVGAIAIAVIGIGLGAMRRSTRSDRPAEPVTPVTESATPVPPQPEAPTVAAPEAPTRVDEAPSHSEPQPPATIAKATPAPASPHPASRRRPSAPAPSATPAPVPTTPPELPSLMEAITDAVRSSPTAGATAPNHR
jgi:hypothetical protein